MLIDRRVPEGYFSTTTYAYDGFQRLKTETNPRGNDTDPAARPAGLLTTLTDPPGNTMSWEYDELGRVEKEFDAYGNSKRFSYDEVGNLTHSVNRLDQITVFIYDDLNRVTSERWWLKIPDDLANLDGPFTHTAVHSINALYDDAGNVSSVETVQPNAAQDDGGHLYTRKFPQSQVQGQAAFEKITVERDHDRRDRMTAERVDHGALVALFFEITYEYHDGGVDQAGRLVATELLVEGDTYRVDRTHDSIGRVVSTAQSGAGLQIGSGDFAATVDFVYDEVDRVETIDRYAPTGLDRNVETFNVWDAAGRLDQTTHYRDGRVVSGFRHYHDAAGRVVGHRTAVGGQLDPSYDGVYGNGRETHFSHDAAGQLLKVDRNGSVMDEVFAYDAGGNWAYTKSYELASFSGFEVDTGHRLRKDQHFIYGYDAEGRLTYRYGYAGPHAGELSRFDWDHRSRLAAVENFKGATLDPADPDGYAILDDGTSVQRVEHTYDGLGRRAVKRVDGDRDSTQPRDGVEDRGERYAFDGVERAALADLAGVTLSRTMLSPQVDRPPGGDADRRRPAGRRRAGGPVLPRGRPPRHRPRRRRPRERLVQRPRVHRLRPHPRRRPPPGGEDARLHRPPVGRRRGDVRLPRPDVRPLVRPLRHARPGGPGGRRLQLLPLRRQRPAERHRPLGDVRQEALPQGGQVVRPHADQSVRREGRPQDRRRAGLRGAGRAGARAAGHRPGRGRGGAGRGGRRAALRRGAGRRNAARLRGDGGRDHAAGLLR